MFFRSRQSLNAEAAKLAAVLAPGSMLRWCDQQVDVQWACMTRQAAVAAGLLVEEDEGLALGRVLSEPQVRKGQ